MEKKSITTITPDASVISRSGYWTQLKENMMVILSSWLQNLNTEKIY